MLLDCSNQGYIKRNTCTKVRTHKKYKVAKFKRKQHPSNFMMLNITGLYYFFGEQMIGVFSGDHRIHDSLIINF